MTISGGLDGFYVETYEKFGKKYPCPYCKSDKVFPKGFGRGLLNPDLWQIICKKCKTSGPKLVYEEFEEGWIKISKPFSKEE
jgi:hypothetical protein